MQEPAEHPDTALIVQPDREVGPGMLIVIHGPDKGRVFHLDGEPTLRLGTDGADVCLSDSRVRRHHALITRGHRCWTIQPMERSNRVRVNQAAITAPIALHDGDYIQVGTTVLVYASTGVPAREDPHHAVTVPQREALPSEIGSVGLPSYVLPPTAAQRRRRVVLATVMTVTFLLVAAVIGVMTHMLLRQQTRVDDMSYALRDHADETTRLRRMVLEVRGGSGRIDEVIRRIDDLARSGVESDEALRSEVLETLEQRFDRERELIAEEIAGLQASLAGAIRPAEDGGLEDEADIDRSAPPGGEERTADAEAPPLIRPDVEPTEPDRSDGAGGLSRPGPIVFLLDESGTSRDTQMIIEDMRTRLAGLDRGREVALIRFGAGEMSVARGRIDGLSPIDDVFDAAATTVGGEADLIAAFARAEQLGARRIVLLSNRAAFTGSGGIRPAELLRDLDRILDGREVSVDTVQYFYREPLPLVRQIASAFNGEHEFMIEIKAAGGTAGAEPAGALYDLSRLLDRSAGGSQDP